jgi:hypothetical protein
MAKQQTKKPKHPAKKVAAVATISEKIEIPGARPATFKLIERAKDSYLLYRSSRKLGTARVEENGEWTARIGEGKAAFVATAKSGPDLLKLVGTWLLAREAREAAARPVEEANPELRIKGKKSPEERLSIEFAKRAQAARTADLDALLAELERNIKRLPKESR